MKKIGIVTLNGYFNYGNRLQNYALQETINKLGFDTTTVIIKNYTENGIEIYENYNKTVNSSMIQSSLLLTTKIKNKLKAILKNVRYSEKIDGRTKIFMEFTQNYISETKIDYNIPSNITELEGEFQYFVTGSDQVWNPNYLNGSSLNFLTFAEPKKRISYSASFGVHEIDGNLEKAYSKLLNAMSSISVRENAGAKIVSQISENESVVLVDPTLLIDKNSWMKISKPAKNKPKSKFLLTYFLGGVPKIYQKQIKTISETYGLDIINLGDIKETETYLTGPSEFLDYINSASIFLTDSFHGVVFSILFETPFIVYERKGSSFSMYSRIETILEKFSLENRQHKYVDLKKDLFEIDFSSFQNIISAEREKSLEFLKNAFNSYEVMDNESK